MLLRGGNKLYLGIKKIFFFNAISKIRPLTKYQNIFLNKGKTNNYFMNIFFFLIKYVINYYEYIKLLVIVYITLEPYFRRTYLIL